MTGQGGAQAILFRRCWLCTDEVSAADDDDSFKEHYRRNDALTLDVFPIGNRAGISADRYRAGYFSYLLK